MGTNSVKMALADLADPNAPALFDQTIITRLGEGMQAQTPRLREAAMRRTLDALADLTQAAREHGVTRLVAVGTAAVRDAENRDEFIRRVQERCGLMVEAIAGEEEARLSYMAVRRDPLWSNAPRLLVIDIGGGSTEIIQGEPGSDAIAARVSVGLGAVRVTERFLLADPPTVAQLAEANQSVIAHLAQAHIESDPALPPFTVVGVGGTLTNLGAMDRGGRTDDNTLHGHSLPAERLEKLVEQLAARTVEERKKIPGLDPRRADIILGGALLLSQVLAHAGASAVQVSTRGLRWGLLYDRFLP